ncbi:Fur family transcriptional regulator [Sulfuricurvum sp.]|uniref:Fur family transcriptional regulator n=1 Tax=Sulfuricurvum sp. TaxID=2025608 RepID=UPI0019B51C55|nr:Fur family transcriptional regulator [Sulfuricurvum sp.]MBD3799607.1 transcriptional repressor [Campylobacterota bacterium]MBD3806434.1 transcriptional repressor [Sulfuricurvum sp.]
MKHELLLKSNHLKATPQRLAIIDLMDRAGHISIDDLFQSIRQRFSSISLATLYKNIHTMMEKNLIREVKIPSQKTKYEIEKESHAHVMCECCGELKDIHFDPNTLLQTSIDVHNYQTKEVSIVILGICPECQKK